jgi:hypothetical protein
MPWDDKVTKYLPAFLVSSDPYVTREITIVATCSIATSSGLVPARATWNWMMAEVADRARG